MADSGAFRATHEPSPALHRVLALRVSVTAMVLALTACVTPTDRHYRELRKFYCRPQHSEQTKKELAQPRYWLCSKEALK